MASVLSAGVPMVFLDYRPLSVKLSGLRSVAANATNLPFASNSLSSLSSLHVIEHVGLGRYGDPLDSTGTKRAASELERVLQPGGRLFLDFPNGRFPIDFWHGVQPGGARFHSPGEGFLPTVPEIRALCAQLGGRLAVSALSPEGRLRFHQVSSHWYGRLFRAPMAALYRLMSVPLFRFLAATPLNPYLVIEVRRPAEKSSRD